MKTLITIMAHREAQEIFTRHFPVWWDLGHDLMIACPAQQSVALPEIRRHGRHIQTLEVGKAEHHGFQSIVRFRTILEIMNGQGYDRYAFFEYDALCLGHDLPEFKGDVAGNVFRDNSPDRGFEGTMFSHPPLVFTAAGLAKIVEVMTQLPLSAEKSVWDRWFGLAVEKSGLAIHNFLEHEQGFSANTIEKNQLDQLFRSIRGGVSMVHGVKSPECFQVCMAARALQRSVEHVKSNHGKIIWEE
jgi:hypothetical protein